MSDNKASKGGIRLEQRTLQDGTCGYDVYDENGNFIRYITQRQLKWNMYSHTFVNTIITGSVIALGLVALVAKIRES